VRNGADRHREAARADSFLSYDPVAKRHGFVARPRPDAADSYARKHEVGAFDAFLARRAGTHVYWTAQLTRQAGYDLQAILIGVVQGQVADGEFGVRQRMDE
jgi:hypothetical protein